VNDLKSPTPITRGLAALEPAYRSCRPSHPRVHAVRPVPRRRRPSVFYCPALGFGGGWGALAPVCFSRDETTSGPAAVHPPSSSVSSGLNRPDGAGDEIAQRTASSTRDTRRRVRRRLRGPPLKIKDPSHWFRSKSSIAPASCVVVPRARARTLARKSRRTHAPRGPVPSRHSTARAAHRTEPRHQVTKAAPASQPHHPPRPIWKRETNRAPHAWAPRPKTPHPGAGL